jgi:hypothetical protein
MQWISTQASAAASGLVKAVEKTLQFGAADRQKVALNTGQAGDRCRAIAPHSQPAAAATAVRRYRIGRRKHLREVGACSSDILAASDVFNA